MKQVVLNPFKFPGKGRPLFVGGMGLISILPLFLVGFGFFSPLSVLVSGFSTVTFAAYSSQNEAFKSSLNLLFVVSFFFTFGLSAPLYWFFGILMPFLENRRTQTNADTGRGRTLLLSLAPAVTLALSNILVQLFPSAIWIWLVPLFTALGAVSYFSFHVFRHPIQTLNREFLWILSFLMTGTLSLPFYWFKRIYKPTLFPANVVLEPHDLWGAGVGLSHNSERLESEGTVAISLDFSSKEVSEFEVNIFPENEGS